MDNAHDNDSLHNVPVTNSGLKSGQNDDENYRPKSHSNPIGPTMKYLPENSRGISIKRPHNKHTRRSPPHDRPSASIAHSNNVLSRAQNDLIDPPAPMSIRFRNPSRSDWRKRTQPNSGFSQAQNDAINPHGPMSNRSRSSSRTDWRKRTPPNSGFSQSQNDAIDPRAPTSDRSRISSRPDRRKQKPRLGTDSMVPRNESGQMIFNNKAFVKSFDQETPNLSKNNPFPRTRNHESTSSRDSNFANNAAGSSKYSGRGNGNHRDNDRAAVPSTSGEGDALAENRPKRYHRRTFVIADSTQRNARNAEERRRGNVTPVGYTYLKELLEKETTQIATEFLNPDSAIQVFLSTRELKTDWLFLLVKIVSNVCSYELKDLRNSIINRVCKSEFLHAVSFYLGEISIEERRTTMQNIPSFVADLIEFYSSVINFLPSVAVDKGIPKLIVKTKKAIDSIVEDLGLSVDDSLLGKLEAQQGKIEEHQRVLLQPPKAVHKQSYLQFLSNQPPPEDFRELDLYPTYEDLTRESFGFVRPNITEGAYNDEEHYLDVQFRLLREDFIDPLRRALNQYLEAKANVGKVRLKYKYESLRLYPQCSFVEIKTNERNQLSFVVNFDPNRKMKIKWEYAKRFMFGSLLLFTYDDFTTFFYGTVFNRDLKMLQQGQIQVTFPNDVQTDKDLFSKVFLMAESEVFFEPYFLVMKSLKTLNAENFPMAKYIVYGESNTNYPSYVHPLMPWNVFGCQVDPCSTAYWPNPEELGLDLHQNRAFRKALTSEFCVIQGPPGTGKTFIGLKIVQVLLDNIQANKGKIRSPLLIVCFTNHALDQFLEGILQYTKKIIRVGGQSKSDVLKDFNLRGQNQKHLRFMAAQKLGPTFLELKANIKAIQQVIRAMTQQKEELKKPAGILKHSTLRSVMTEEQKTLLKDAETLLRWLLQCEDDRPKNKKREDPDAATNKSDEEVQVDDCLPDHEEENEEENELVDEDDVFQADIGEETKEALNSDYPYEVTVDEISSQCIEKIELVKYLKNLDDEEIMADYAAYHNDLLTAERELEILVRQHDILKEQLTNPHCSVEKIKRIVAKDIGVLSSLDERWTLYWSWVKIMRENVTQEMQRADEELRILMSKYEELKQLEDLHVVQEALVVGMTTTCAARLHTLLSALKPAIVVVEEAAEVLETHIVTSLTKSCQHVILIGDHKQLKPSAAVYKLAQDFKIDVSLFERMINNGMDCPMLNVQHRMRPEISRLITPLIYEDLKDDPSVFQFENIKGVAKNLFFLEHDHHEQDVEDTSSRQNTFEVDFMIEFCCYLILQGYDPEKITILTTYTGQMFALREKKRRRQLIQAVKCIVVDKYQGEENDIILLSLVRSNKEAKIGFLKTENRVCVALSRARKGFFIVGNMDNLTKSSPALWGKISETLRQQGAIGREMSLHCARHDIYTPVSEPKHFNAVREGGCSLFCGDLLRCGHECNRLCHPLDREHELTKCHEPCSKNCARDRHPCKRLCFENCGKCTEKLTWDLPCAHSKSLPCYVDVNEYLCDEIVDDVAPLCNHSLKRACHQNVEDVACPHPCEDRLECGHQCRNTCHKNKDPDHIEYKCQKKCGKLNKMCSREHKCEKACFEECGLCTIKVEFKLNCGHEKKLPCSVDFEKIKCFDVCKKKCVDCGQQCRKKCFEDCKPCEYKVEKIIPECGHSVMLPCCKRPSRLDCTKMCQRLLTCGHKCSIRCRDDCDASKCKMLTVVNVRGLCGHNYVRVPCSESANVLDDERLRELLKYCDAPCDTLLKCGDVCAGTCGACWQGRLHQLCQQNCGSIGICGHSCKYPCRQSCPPCEEKCSFRCQHTICPKKCGVPCVDCQEPCEWQCPHQKCTRKCGAMCDREPCREACPKTLECGHPCIGFCGEPCPPECRECNPEITEIMFGYEDEENARFVHLVDCKHTVESQALDQHLNVSPQGGEIVMKVCPLCKTPITRTLRYMNYVKKTYVNIQKVKVKIFGTEKTLLNQRKKLEKEIRLFVSANGTNFSVTRLRKIDLMANEYASKLEVRPKRKNTVSNAELNTIEFFYRVLEDISSRLKDLWEYNEQTRRPVLHGGDIVENIVRFVEALLGRMQEPAIQVNEQLSADIATELQRYHKMVDYSLVLRNVSYLQRKDDARVQQLVLNLRKSIFGVERFDRVSKFVENEFQYLQEALKADVPLTSEEKRMLHAAMSSSFSSPNATGHWFTCSKGHPYVITECGGAMERGKCPECGETIGGTQHQTVETAVLASDFDGAQHPAWGPHYDMRNFQM